MGRPTKSQTRQNIVDILHFMGSAYGYEIYKAYITIFPKTTLRNIYYQLKKGLATEEFKAEKVETVKGEYSWGPEAEKTYYVLGPNAKPTATLKVKKHFEKK
jgi:hypothetical protein